MGGTQAEISGLPSIVGSLGRMEETGRRQEKTNGVRQRGNGGRGEPSDTSIDEGICNRDKLGAIKMGSNTS